MGSPDRGEPVERRQLGIRVVGDIQHREVVLVERPGQHAERHRHEDPLARDRGPGCRHPAAVAERRPGQAEPGLRAGQEQRDDEREKTQFYDHSILPWRAGAQVLPWFCALRRLCVRLQAVLDLGRHVVLVMLGEHFLGHEHAVRAHLAARNDALSFAEQVRQHARVADALLVRIVGQREAHFEAARLALEAAVLDQPAHAERAGARRLARLDLGRAVVIQQVLLERLQREGGGDADAGEDSHHRDHAFLTWGHVRCSLSIVMRRRALACCSASMRRAAHQLASSTTAVRPYAVQTNPA